MDIIYTYSYRNILNVTINSLHYSRLLICRYVVVKIRNKAFKSTTTMHPNSIYSPETDIITEVAVFNLDLFLCDVLYPGN